MQHKKNTKRIGALARRREDIKKYEKLLKSPQPKKYRDKDTGSAEKWRKFLERKLNLAINEVAKLETLVEKERTL